MKKIFSLLLAIAVMATSLTAFAAVSVTDDGGGNMLADSTTIPAKSYYLATVPSTSIDVTQLTTKADVKNASTTAFSNQASLSTYDVYKLDITVDDLGEIVNGYDENWDSAYGGVYNVTVGFPTTAFEKSYIAAGQIDGGTAGAGQDGGIFNVTWSASAVNNPYPVFDENADPVVTQYQANGSMTITLLVAIATGTTLNLSTVDTIVVYAGGNFTGGSAENNNAAKATLTLPPTPSTIPVSSVTISGATSATVGDSVALTATVLPGDATDSTVTWTKVSGDGAVSDAGVVTANSAGDIVVKATAGGVDSANYTVTFAAATVAVSSVTISGATSATVGDSVALTATVLPGNATDPSVTWTKVSGDGAVSAAGVVTANSAGDIVVKATAGGVDSANYTVTFAAATIPATGVTINGGAAKAVVGDSVTFTATVDPSASTDPVVWSVTGEGANVENGVVTSTKPGNVTVTATAGSVSDVKTVTFVDAPAAPVIENNYSSPAQIGGYNYITGNAAVAAPDFTNFVYKAWAKDEIGGAKHYFDASINDLLAGKFEGGATYNFILMVKSAAHELVDCGIDALLK